MNSEGSSAIFERMEIGFLTAHQHFLGQTRSQDFSLVLWCVQVCLAMDMTFYGGHRHRFDWSQGQNFKTPQRGTMSWVAVIPTTGMIVISFKALQGPFVVSGPSWPS